MPDVGSELFSRAKTLGLIPILSDACFDMMNVPSSSTSGTASLLETCLLALVPFDAVGERRLFWWTHFWAETAAAMAIKVKVIFSIPNEWEY